MSRSRRTAPALLLLALCTVALAPPASAADHAPDAAPAVSSGRAHSWSVVPAAHSWSSPLAAHSWSVVPVAHSWSRTDVVRVL